MLQINPLTAIEVAPDARFNGIGQLLRLTGDLDPSTHVGQFLALNPTGVAPIASPLGATIAASGAAYTSVADAADAQEPLITVVGATTETRDPQFTVSTVFNVAANVPWTLGDYQNRIVADNIELNFYGYGNVIWSPTTSKNLFDTSLTPFTADTANGFPTLTNISIDATVELRVGGAIYGPGINVGTKIVSIDSPTQVTLNQNATADGIGVSINNSQNAGNVNCYIQAGINLDGTGGTADNCHIFDGIVSGVLNGLARLFVPNQNDWGFHSGGAFVEFRNGIVAVISLTAGTNCYNCYSASGTLNQLVLVGNFDPINDAVTQPSGSYINRVTYFDITGAPINLSLGGTVLGLNNVLGAGDVNVTFSANSAILKNARLGNGNLSGGGFSYLSLNTVTTAGNLDLSNSEGSCDFTAVTVDGTTTINGNNNKFDLTCRFNGGITNTGLNNLFPAAINPAFDGVSPASAQLPFSFGDASPEFIVTVPAGKTVYEVRIDINTPFDGVGAALEVGDTGTPDQLMTAAQNDPSLQGSYISSPAFVYVATTQVKLSITPGAGATQGSGVLVLSMQS